MEYRRSILKKGQWYHGGYTVVAPSEVIEAVPLPLATSAQQAALYALT